ncbi:MAG: amino acid permease [Candidatus Micrarchaeota archaeon]|nr:amino acid permease [Candidatus Micrarchaeota archaeon]
MARLKRVLNFWEALAINIGAIIGAGIFVISGLAAGIAGPAVLISIVVGAAIALCTGLGFAAMSHAISAEGGGYKYAEKLLGRYAGLVSGLTFIISGSIAGAAMALSFGSYFASIFGLGISPVMAAIALVAVLGAINYLGVKDSADVSVALVVVKIAVLALFVVAGLLLIKPGNYTPFVPNGTQSVLVASAFIFFAYTGFARIATLGEEVKDPKRTVPKVIISSVIISMAIYFLVMFVLIGMTNYTIVSGSAAPLSTAIIDATHNPTIGLVIALGAIVATVNVALTMILGLSRVVFSMARDASIPRLFSRLNRFGTPTVAIAVIVILMAATVLAVGFKDIVAISNSGVLVSYVVANIAAFALLYRGAGALKGTWYSSRYFKVVPVLGAALSIVLMAFLTGLSMEITAVVLALITLYYLSLRRRSSSK